MYLPAERSRQSALVAIPEVDSETSRSPRSSIESDLFSDEEEATQEKGHQTSLRRKCWLVLGIELASAALAATASAAFVLQQDPVVSEHAGRRLAADASMAVNGIFPNPYEEAVLAWPAGGISDTVQRASVHPAAGCSNMELILLKTVTFPSPDDCGKACGITPGCHGFDYQHSACIDGAEGDCHLLSGVCEQKSTNICNSVYSMGAPTKELWYKNASGRGCANWDRIMICSTDMGLSPGACGLKCTNTPGCVGFNYQPTACSGTEMAFQGACLLFSGQCEQELNACWDYYSMVPEVTAKASEHSGQRLRGVPGRRRVRMDQQHLHRPATRSPRWNVEPVASASPNVH